MSDDGGHTPPLESASGSGSASAGHGPPAAPPSQKSRKHASTACTACKAAKKRCVGGVPCRLCTQRNIECTVSESVDGRRGRHVRLKELSARTNKLETILESMKSSDDDSLRNLIDLARAGRPVEQLGEVARQILDQRNLHGTSGIPRRHAVLSIAQLTDDPPIRVPATPWTNVTSDDDAVSHLISIYFTWHHCAYPAMEPNLFIQDMQSKDLSSRFCSPLLVNAMLTTASMYTDHPCAFQDAEDPSTRGLHFLEETERLLKLEEGKVSLTILQAYPPLLSSTVFLGRDRIGARYAHQSTLVCVELKKHVKLAIRQGLPGYENSDFQRSYRSAMRAAFMIQTEVAVAWMRPLSLFPPRTLAPYEGKDLYRGDTWKAYPLVSEAVSFFPFVIDEQRYELFVIVAKLLPLVLSGNPEDSPLDGQVVLDPLTKLDQLGEVELKLLKWHRHLPAEAKLDLGDGLPLIGPLLDMHLAYSGFDITIQSLFLRTMSSTDPNRNVAKEKIIQASRSIVEIFKSLQHVLGQGYFGVVYAHAATVSALNLLEFLEEPAVSSLFHELVSVQCTVARRWILARGIVKTLWHTLQERKLVVHLEDATRSLLRLFAVETWGAEDHKLFELCAYPNYAEIKDKGRDFVEIGELLQQYTALDLDRQEEEDI